MLSIFTFFHFLKIYTVRFDWTIIACYIGIWLIGGGFGTLLLHLYPFDLSDLTWLRLLAGAVFVPLAILALFWAFVFIVAGVSKLGFIVYKVFYLPT